MKTDPEEGQEDPPDALVDVDPRTGSSALDELLDEVVTIAAEGGFFFQS